MPLCDRRRGGGGAAASFRNTAEGEECLLLGDSFSFSEESPSSLQGSGVCSSAFSASTAASPRGGEGGAGKVSASYQLLLQLLCMLFVWGILYLVPDSRQSLFLIPAIALSRLHFAWILGCAVVLCWRWGVDVCWRRRLPSQPLSAEGSKETELGSCGLQNKSYWRSRLRGSLWSRLPLLYGRSAFFLALILASFWTASVLERRRTAWRSAGDAGLSSSNGGLLFTPPPLVLLNAEASPQLRLVAAAVGRVRALEEELRQKTPPAFVSDAVVCLHRFSAAAAFFGRWLQTRVLAPLRVLLRREGASQRDAREASGTSWRSNSERREGEFEETAPRGGGSNAQSLATELPSLQWLRDALRWGSRAFSDSFWEGLCRREQVWRGLRRSSSSGEAAFSGRDFFPTDAERTARGTLGVDELEEEASASHAATLIWLLALFLLATKILAQTLLAGGWTLASAAGKALPETSFLRRVSNALATRASAETLFRSFSTAFAWTALLLCVLLLLKTVAAAVLRLSWRVLRALFRKIQPSERRLLHSAAAPVDDAKAPGAFEEELRGKCFGEVCVAVFCAAACLLADRNFVLALWGALQPMRVFLLGVQLVIELPEAQTKALFKVPAPLQEPALSLRRQTPLEVIHPTALGAMLGALSAAFVFLVLLQQLASQPPAQASDAKRGQEGGLGDKEEKLLGKERSAADGAQRSNADSPSQSAAAEVLALESRLRELQEECEELRQLSERQAEQQRAKRQALVQTEESLSRERHQRAEEEQRLQSLQDEGRATRERLEALEKTRQEEAQEIKREANLALQELRKVALVTGDFESPTESAADSDSPVSLLQQIRSALQTLQLQVSRTHSDAVEGGGENDRRVYSVQDSNDHDSAGADAQQIENLKVVIKLQHQQLSKQKQQQQKLLNERDEKLQKLEAEYNNSLGASAAQRDLQDTLTSILQQKDQEIGELKNLISQIKEEYEAELEEKLAEYTRMLQTEGRKDEIEKQMAEIKFQRDEVEKSRREVESQKAEVENQKFEMESQKAEVENRRRAIKFQEDALEKQKGDLELQREELEIRSREVKSQRDEIEKWQAKLAAQRDEVDQRKHEVESQKAELMEMQKREVENRTREIKSQEDEVEKQKAELATQRDEIEERKREMESQRAEMALKQKAEVENRKREMKSQKDEIEKQRAELARQKAELENRSREMENQRDEVEKRKAELARQKAEIENRNREVKSQRDELESSKSEMKIQRDDLEKRKAELAKQKAELENRNREMENQKTDMERRKAELETKRRELQSLEDGLEKQKAELKWQREEMDRDKRAMESQRDDLERRQAELSTQRGEVEEQRREVESQKRKVEEQQRKVAEASLSDQKATTSDGPEGESGAPPRLPSWRQLHSSLQNFLDARPSCACQDHDAALKAIRESIGRLSEELKELVNVASPERFGGVGELRQDGERLVQSSAETTEKVLQSLDKDEEKLGLLRSKVARSCGTLNANSATASALSPHLRRSCSDSCSVTEAKKALLLPSDLESVLRNEERCVFPLVRVLRRLWLPPQVLREALAAAESAQREAQLKQPPPNGAGRALVEGGFSVGVDSSFAFSNALACVRSAAERLEKAGDPGCSETSTARLAEGLLVLRRGLPDAESCQRLLHSPAHALSPIEQKLKPFIEVEGHRERLQILNFVLQLQPQYQQQLLFLQSLRRALTAAKNSRLFNRLQRQAALLLREVHEAVAKEPSSSAEAALSPLSRRVPVKFSDLFLRVTTDGELKRSAKAQRLLEQLQEIRRGESLGVRSLQAAAKLEFVHSKASLMHLALLRLLEEEEGIAQQRLSDGASVEVQLESEVEAFKALADFPADEAETWSEDLERLLSSWKGEWAFLHDQRTKRLGESPSSSRSVALFWAATAPRASSSPQTEEGEEESGGSLAEQLEVCKSLTTLYIHSVEGLKQSVAAAERSLREALRSMLGEADLLERQTHSLARLRGLPGGGTSPVASVSPSLSASPPGESSWLFSNASSPQQQAPSRTESPSLSQQPSQSSPSLPWQPPSSSLISTEDLHTEGTAASASRIQQSVKSAAVFARRARQALLRVTQAWTELLEEPREFCVLFGKEKSSVLDVLLQDSASPGSSQRSCGLQTQKFLCELSVVFGKNNSTTPETRSASSKAPPQFLPALSGQDGASLLSAPLKTPLVQPTQTTTPVPVATYVQSAAEAAKLACAAATAALANFTAAAAVPASSAAAAAAPLQTQFPHATLRDGAGRGTRGAERQQQSRIPSAPGGGGSYNNPTTNLAAGARAATARGSALSRLTSAAAAALPKSGPWPGPGGSLSAHPRPSSALAPPAAPAGEERLRKALQPARRGGALLAKRVSSVGVGRLPAASTAAGTRTPPTPGRFLGAAVRRGKDVFAASAKTSGVAGAQTVEGAPALVSSLPTPPPRLALGVQQQTNPPTAQSSPPSNNNPTANAGGSSARESAQQEDATTAPPQRRSESLVFEASPSASQSEFPQEQQEPLVVSRSSSASAEKEGRDLLKKSQWERSGSSVSDGSSGGGGSDADFIQVEAAGGGSLGKE